MADKFHIEVFVMYSCKHTVLEELWPPSQALADRMENEGAVFPEPCKECKEAKK